MKRTTSHLIRAEKRHELLTELMEKINDMPIGSNVVDVIIHPDGLQGLLITETEHGVT